MYKGVEIAWRLKVDENMVIVQGGHKMATEIKCEKKVIQEIFELWYRIPEYQRPYVWESD